MPAAPTLPAPDGAAWSWPIVSAGYDAYLHTFHLADQDTTELVAEYVLALGIAGRSPLRARHQWQLRAEGSGGSELARGLLEAGYRFRPGSDRTLLRCDLAWLGRRYRQGTAYALSSDGHEGKLDLRLAPWRLGPVTPEVRAQGRFVDFSAPSPLELDRREGRVGLYLRADGPLAGGWQVGALAGRRVHPDSSAIDRDLGALEGQVSRSDEAGDLFLYHRSERRRIADETVRPSAWSHWSEARLALRTGGGKLLLNLDSELWRYDREEGAWFDSWRLEGEAGYGWGDILGAAWQLLATAGRLDAGEQPETYTEAGLRGALESGAGRFCGSVSLEVGRRWHADDPAAPAASVTPPDLAFVYSDFTYVEVLVIGSLALSRHLGLDLLAGWRPERHTERDDDAALGHGSLRLAWRP